MQHTLKTAITALTVLPLLSCTAPKAAREPQPAVAPVAANGPVAAGALWLVSQAESLITIEVLRGGPLASLGHNHVIAARQILGELHLASALQQSSFTLILPVSRFAVDEAALRSAAGPDFTASVPDAARDGTRGNMLGENLLDAARFPNIEIESQRMQRTAAGLIVDVRVRLRGTEHVLHLPCLLRIDAAHLSVSGDFLLRQSELGLTPFSIMLGALQVQDQMHVRFGLVAHPASPTAAPR